MFFSMVRTNMRSEVRTRFFFLMTIWTIEHQAFHVTEVMLHMVRYHMFQLVKLLADAALPHRASVLALDLLHVLLDRIVEVF